MRYFVPTLVFPTEEQAQFVEKFGGNPWGLPQERWPLCAECGKPLTHLFSLQHHSERLDLGREGRQVLVFQCNHDPGMCETWSAGSGANAVLFLDPEDSTDTLTELPEPEPETEVETLVTAWEASEDEVDSANYDIYFDEKRLWDFHGKAWTTPETEEWMPMFEGTKLGSVPAWVQSASEGPEAPFRFVGQFHMEHEATGTVPDTIDRTRHHITERDGVAEFKAANYGDLGSAYLFIAPDPVEPRGLFFWQCG